MSVFGEYASTYDSFYADKNYAAEVAYVRELARKHGLASPASLLDMGCGTAGHIIPFAAGIETVHGFDRSAEMIAIAEKKLKDAHLEKRIHVAVGDLVSYRSGRTYDLVVSMFAVMGYLVANEAFAAGLATAHAHLAKGGLFVFDVWAGSAVLHTMPETRIQRFNVNGRNSLRLVRPHVDPVRQCVAIEYEILSFDGDTVVNRITERHEMRYFFEQEVRYFLSTTGFELLEAGPFMAPHEQKTLGTWNLTFVARAV